MIETVKNYVIMLLVALLVTTSLATWQYRRMFKATDFALQTQNKAIEDQNHAAEKKYETLKGERDALQNERDVLAGKLEKQGEKAKSALADDSSRDPAPVVVRYISRPARSCGDGGAGAGASAAKPGAGDSAVSSGVLAPEAQELLKRDADNVERLQAAFNLCAEKVTR